MPRRKKDDKFKDKKNRKKSDSLMRRKRPCKFCRGKVEQINYKAVAKLQSYITERGKILPRRISGNCAKHQRRMTTAIKQARQIALLPFVAK